jgi:hypothetical protein
MLIASGQNTETARKLIGDWVLKALPSDISGRREDEGLADSRPATTLSAMCAYRWRVADDYEPIDHYAAERW